MNKHMLSDPSEFIVPLNINGLQGRMLKMPAPANRKREILFVYGHHSSLERWWGLMQDLNQYGSITMPDLPGFGGMESLYKIGLKPDVDMLADYLAAFVKMRYNRRRLTIVGLSFGFVVATRMLQRYPDLVKKVDLVVSIVGFSHKDDFAFTKKRRRLYLAGASLVSLRLPAVFFRNVLLHPFVLRAAYARTHNAKHKFAQVSADEFGKTMDFEIELWHANDVRTHMKTTVEMLKVDNCTSQLAVPLWHISTDVDRYFDNHVVEQHLQVIYPDFHHVKSKMKGHAPSVIADAKAAAPLIPPKIRRLLARS